MVSKLTSVDSIKWDDRNKPLNLDDLLMLTQIPFVLPIKFFELMQISDGGYVDYDFEYFDISCSRKIGAGIPCIYGIVEGKKDNIIYKYLNPPEFFPKNIVAFSDTGGGDMICFDYRADHTTDNPPIVYWNHESEPEESVSFIAKNFEEFLGILKEPEDKEEYNEEEFQEWLKKLP